jgi:transcriptional regulator with XRE-family HTH domain
MKKPKLPTPSLDAGTAEKVLAADLGNLLKRVQAGTPLTGRQRALIESAAAPAAPAKPDDAPGEDRNQPPRSPAELARRLGVSRQRVCSWMQRKDAPDVSDVRAWRHFLSQFARVKLSPDDSEAKPTAPGERNPAPRLWLCDGAYLTLERLGHDLPARLATLCTQAGLTPTQPQIDGLAIGLFSAVTGETNAVLARWKFEPYMPEDWPDSIIQAAERLA